MEDRDRSVSISVHEEQGSAPVGSCGEVGAVGSGGADSGARVASAASGVGAPMAPSPARARPFLKWAGGKTSMLPHLLPLVPKGFGVYHEPFVGGGALFWALRPERAVLSDANKRLVRTYAGVRDCVDSVVHFLQRSPHSKQFFLKLRQWRVDSAVDDASVAAWMIYLNKTAFNGLYRVNGNGRFNVPFGNYENPRICDEPNLRACSSALQGVTLLHADFATVTSRAEPGDVVYFDPPYLPISATSSFTGYTPGGFTLGDHVRLRDVGLALKARGVHVIVSNSAAPELVELYSKGFTVTRVRASRSVAAAGSSRGKVDELIIR